MIDWVNDPQWQVWVQSQEFNGAMSYIYPFRVSAPDANEAIDYVLNHYCATRDGRRFLSDSLTRLVSAWAAKVDDVTEVQLEQINQPQYKRQVRV